MQSRNAAREQASIAAAGAGSGGLLPLQSANGSSIPTQIATTSNGGSASSGLFISMMAPEYDAAPIESRL